MPRKARAIEVLGDSPSTGELGFELSSGKRDVYSAAGVPWYWQVDIRNRTITVLRLTTEGYVDHQTAGDEGSANLAPFDAVALELAGLFPPART